VGDYVYQPTRILQSVAELSEEIRSGKIAEHTAGPLVPGGPPTFYKGGNRHQTDVFSFHKPRPRPAMTK
jgi:hypothetical protein